MATKGNKALDAREALKARAAQAVEAVRGTGAASEAVADARSAVRKAAEEVQSEPPKKAKKAAKRVTRKAKEGTGEVEKDTGETQVGTADKALTTDPPAEGGMGLTLPKPGQTTRIKFPRDPDPVPPSPQPREPQGPPVADLIADAKDEGVRIAEGPPNMTEAAAASLRKIMSSSKADVARERSEAARQARRESEYPNLLSELRQRRQESRSGNAEMDRLRRTQATLIAELRRRTEARRSPAYVQGPEVGDLAARPKRWFGGSSSQATKATQPPQGGERGRVLPSQYGMIRWLLRGAKNKAVPAIKKTGEVIGRSLEDAAIIGTVGVGVPAGWGAVGGAKGIGNFIATGSTRGEQPPAQEQGQEGQPAKKPSYGEQFKQKARQSRQTPSGNSGTLQKLKKIRGEV